MFFYHCNANVYHSSTYVIQATRRGLVGNEEDAPSDAVWGLRGKLLDNYQFIFVNSIGWQTINLHEAILRYADFF